MVRTILAAFAILAFANAANAELIRKPSPYSVPETLDRLEKILKAKGLTIFARIDHAAGGKRVGLELRPTTLLIFGNPKVGTKLMQAEQTMGLTLPLKVLAWKDGKGKVWLGYDAPVAAGKQRGLDHPILNKVAGALDKLTNAALKQ